ncbi:MAG TPA: vitamin B12-dependent ribonucleotide reductase [Chthonomonadales bacterium]|nr:vitamin B12-dependent ribonucleotide reductase [Chthonomonadales bacterium]
MDIPVVADKCDEPVEAHNADGPALSDRAAVHGSTRREASVPTGLRVPRRFTEPGEDVWASVEWARRSAVITGERGEVVFEQHDIEAPADWSQLAVNVVASKYFRGHVGTAQRERSVRHLIERVAHTIAEWGRRDGYFASEGDFAAFRDELSHLLLHQKAAFNSPVWFNVGLADQPKPQCSACFINSVTDTMDSILTLARTEGMLFKFGSGTGTNFSTLRSSKERLHGGGTASGPVSFMRGYDAFAGVIKSGGKTRRAAKMVILNVDHPDVVDFITCKANEERKAWALIDAGYNGNFNASGGAYDSVSYQNANHSVRVSDEFMEAYLSDGPWHTREVLTGEVAATHQAQDLMRLIAESAWVCGDPGVQYDTTINRWHTCKSTDRIHASNPCSEYMFLNDSACNLASLNLMEFRLEDREFDVSAFEHACRILITAQEIIVDNASYPTDVIEQNSRDYRPLGLGYANLGALLMSRGVAYDSDAGRAISAAVTALMTGAAYHQSCVVARDCGGPFAGYARNRQSFLGVMRLHRSAVESLDARLAPAGVAEAARALWDRVLSDGEVHGFRNAQSTVLAPTGTIGFMMDCDTTGIEPDIAIVKYKSLVGGGMMKIVNQTVPEALNRLGYPEDQAAAILAHIDARDTIEGAPGLREEHLPVFDCAFRPVNGARSINHMGHVKMMAAVQPFISGAISKTVNMPHEATAEDIAHVYVEGWRQGLKAIAIYRDGSKRTQPLRTRRAEEQQSDVGAALGTPASLEPLPVRRKLPDERRSITHKYSVAGHEGYITVGMYDDGSPGEIFLTMSKEGSTISGLMDTIATMTSLALQYGVPLETLVNKFAHTRFEPSGITPNPQIRFAKSIPDYIFRWLGLKFLPHDAQPAEEATLNGGGAAGLPERRPDPSPVSAFDRREHEIYQLQADAPACADCGALMVRNGACYKCTNCGSTLGCS